MNVFFPSLDKFLVEAGNAEPFDGNVSVDKALKFLGLQNQQEHLPGMVISLMAHQILGVAWMVEKEQGSVKGGCLADEMGLGKVCPLNLSNIISYLDNLF